MNFLLKLVAWTKAEQAAERRFNIEMLCFLPAFFFVWLVTSRFVLDDRQSALLAVVIALPIYLGGRFYLLREATRPESNLPSPVPLSELSRYQLYVEREKAVSAGDAVRLRAIDTEVSLRQ